jgi:hypothetical protein
VALQHRGIIDILDSDRVGGSRILDWNDLARRLAAELVRLPVDAYVIVQGPGGFPYVQAMRFPNGLTGEAVSDAFLSEPQRLDLARIQRMISLGWREPGEQPGGQRRVNWWHDLVIPADLGQATREQLAECDHLAVRMIAALRDVYGVRSPSDLEYRANQNGPVGGPLTLPGLGLESADRQPLAAPPVDAQPAAPPPDGVARPLDVPPAGAKRQDAKARGRKSRPAPSYRPQAPGLQASGPQPSGPQAMGPPVPGPQISGTQLPGPLGAGPQVPGPLGAGPQVPGPLGAGPQVPGPMPGPQVPGPQVSGAAASGQGPQAPRPQVPGAQPLAAPTGGNNGIGWAEFAERLAGELAGLDDGMVLVVHHTNQDAYYVQAHRDPQRVRVEAVGNDLLHKSLRFRKADQKRMADAGWDVPGPNWWVEVPNSAPPAEFRRLAGMMVTALRDVQKARDPADLRYEAFRGETGIELIDLGLTLADPDGASEIRPGRPLPADEAPTDEAANGSPPADSPAAESQAAPIDEAVPTGDATATAASSAPSGPPGSATEAEPGDVPSQPPAASIDPDEVEPALVDAKRRSDQQAYLAVLQAIGLIVPATGRPGVVEFATTQLNDGVYVLAFTSAEVMTQVLGTQAPHHRHVTISRLAEEWPNPVWKLSINLGRPSEAYFDSSVVAELARTAPPETPETPETPEDEVHDTAAAPPPETAAPAPEEAGRTTPDAPSPIPVDTTSRTPADTTSRATAEAPSRTEVGVPSRTTAEAAATETQPDSAAPTGPAVMQKVVPPPLVVHYLEGGYDRVAGYVHKLEDVADLATPERLVNGLGLTYENSPFSPDDELIHLIRWHAYKLALFKTPLGGVDEESMQATPDGWVIELPPFLGTGYAPGDGPRIPEFKIASQRLPHGAEFYRVERSGDAVRVATFDADGGRWVGED